MESISSQEPSAVRTILARAKEVLQSLASDNSKFQAVIEKRGNIARNISSSFEETNSKDIVKKSGFPDPAHSDLIIPEPLVKKTVFPRPAPSDLVVPEPLVKDIAQETAGAFDPKTTSPKKGPEIVPNF